MVRMLRERCEWCVCVENLGFEKVRRFERVVDMEES